MIGQGVAEVGDGVRAPAVPGIPSGQLAWGGLVFVALTAGVLWWLFDRGPGAHAGPGPAALRWGYLPLLLLTLPVETVTSAARIWLICRVLHPGVSFWTCVRSEWANVAISTLTPSQSGGGPGQIYILTRAGVSVGTGLTATLLSFMGTMAGLLLLGLYSLASGAGAHGRLFLVPVWTLTAIAGVLLLGATWPDAIRIALGACSRTIWGALG
ncbi:MAG: lysylphosphatidylglycerol synthase domain-containing protein, partial [Candidatus Rokuibacteriota bacterium]